MKKAKFVCEIVVTDPESKGLVEVSIYKHPNGGMFGVDSSYIDQNFDEDELATVPDVFNEGKSLVKIILDESE